jgi:hypothetical protein
MFMARMVGQPNDILVYGRAIAVSHKPGRDDATPSDIERRSWKAKWPHYVRVHHAEFIGGTLADGVSLNQLMRELRHDAFSSTQGNARRGDGNANPHFALRQQPAVRLSKAGADWLAQRLQAAFETSGRLPATALEQLDWPSLEVV